MKPSQGPKRLIATLVFATALAGCGGAGDSATSTALPTTKAQSESGIAMPSTSAVSTVDPNTPIGEHVQPKNVMGEVSPLRPFPAGPRPIPYQIGLGALPAQTSTHAKVGAATIGAPKISVPRQVSETADVQSTSAILSWSPTADGGLIAALRFTADGAHGLRLGVLAPGLPLGSVLRFSADNFDQVYEVTAQQIFQTVHRNESAGNKSDAARTYWSPNLGGESATMEIVLPPGASSDGVQIAVPRVSHVFVDLAKDGLKRDDLSGACEQDIACSVEFLPMSSSVALMDYVKEDGSGYLCTGTLMNDRASDGIPYFLTAAHCISSQVEASTLTTAWNIRRKTCGGTDYYQNTLNDFLFGGATLLTSNSSTDATLLRLNETPPPGAIFAASYPSTPLLSESLGTIHHPKGDVQKFSVGRYVGAHGILFGDVVRPRDTAAGDANYLGVSWRSGVTEPGSSGSPLLMKLNGVQYVVGQLRGGESSCANTTGIDFFGRFDRSYTAGMSTWLSPYSSETKTPVYRFYNTKTRAHFFTIDKGERDFVIARYSEWSYEGIAFYSYGAQHKGTLPVYRFYNSQSSSTSSP